MQSIFWVVAAFGGLAVTIWRPRYVLVLLPIAIIFSPEFSLFTIGRRELFLTLGDLISLGLLLYLIVKRRIELQSVWLIGGGYLALLIISSIIGIVTGTVASAPLSVFYVAKFTQYLLVGVMISVVIENESDVRSGIAGLALMALLALLALPTVIHEGRVSLPFTGIQETSVIGAMVAILFLPLVVDSDYRLSTPQNVLLMIGILTGLLYIVASAGRAGMLGLGAGLGYLVLKRPELRGWRVGAVACALGMVILPLVFFSDHQALHRIEHSITVVLTLDFSSASSLMTRFSKWERALLLWPTRPVIGVGMPLAGQQWIDGWYVRVLVETGLLGLGIWLWFMEEIYRHVRSAATANAYQTGVVGVLIVMCVSSVFGARFLTTTTAMLFWFIIGTGLAVDV